MNTLQSQPTTSMQPLSLEEANLLVLEKIAISADAMILGFLPLEETEEEAVMAAVKSALKRELVGVEGLLRCAPAATAYALAVAPSRSLTSGGNFWPALESDLDLVVNGTKRGDLAFHFRKVCRHLGLVDGTLVEAGWIHAAPFIFQAGILHYWTDSLATGLLATLSHRPAPDLEDPSALWHFASELEGRIHNQPTLKRLLGTEVGPLLVGRLVTAYIADDWSALPAHLREPIRKAFGEGRGPVVRSPFLAYEFAFREVQLILPAVGASITSPQSHWGVGDRRHAARKETRIPIRELAAGQLTIELRELTGGYETQTFSVDTRFDLENPFRLFRGDTGRERKLTLTPHISVPAGSYVVVMAANVTTNDECYVEPLDDFRKVEVDLRPGDDSLVLKNGEGSWSLSPALVPGFYIDQTRAETALLEDGDWLHFGEDLGLVVFFPANEGEDRTFRLDLQCPEMELQISTELSAPSTAQEGAFIFKSDLQDAIAPFLGCLPSGIHRVTLALSDQMGQVQRVFWYWKGLERISNSLGFACREWPGNLNVVACRGLVRRENALRFEENYNAPFVILALSNPPVTLKLPRAGVRAVVMEPGAAWEDELSPSRSIVVTPDDRRFVTFQAGGFQTWDIVAGHRTIATLDKKRTRYTVSLTGLANEAGGAGRVSATNNSRDSISLFAFTKPLAASQPKVHLDHSEGDEVWKFKVAIEQECALGVRITDLSLCPDPEPSQIENFVCWQEGKLTCQEVRFGAATISVNAYVDEPGSEAMELQSVRVKLTHHIESLVNGLWSVEFYYRCDAETAWTELECVEPHGYSSLHFFAWGDRPVEDDADWWPRLRRAGRQDGRGASDPKLATALGAMEAKELTRALATCRRLSSSKYPSNVWRSNAYRTQDFSVHLAKHRFNVFDDSAPIWWQQASLDVAEHAGAVSTPAVRQLLFATQPAILRLPRGRTAVPPSASNSIITESLAVPPKIHAAKSLRAWILPAVEAEKLNREVLFCYRNFVSVSTGIETEFSDFSLMNFLCGEQGGITGVASAAGKLAEECGRTPPTALLDGGHLLQCIRALNRRCRAIDSAAQGDGDHPLAKAAQALEYVSQQVPILAPRVAQELGWQQPGGAFWWVPPLLENPWAEKVAGVIWLVAALGRLTAHRKLSPADYDSCLERLLTPGKVDERERAVQNRLCIFFSLAPELFAFYTALFELRFPNSPSPNL